MKISKIEKNLYSAYYSNCSNSEKFKNSLRTSEKKCLFKTNAIINSLPIVWKEEKAHIYN